VTRKDFLKAATFPALPAAAQTASGITAGNRHFQLLLDPGRGLRCKLVHTPSGIALADGAYSYSFEVPPFAGVARRNDGPVAILTLEAATPAGLHIKQEYRIPADRPWIEERITLTNRAAHATMLPYGRCGFVLPLHLEGGSVSGPLGRFRLTAVPYRREPTGNRQQYADYTVAQVLTEPRRSQLRTEAQVSRQRDVVYPRGVEPLASPEYASEGWALTDGRQGFLISKYSPAGMEWAVLDRIPVDADHLGLRWGGFGIFQGDPEPGACLAPGQSHSFGVTRITAYEGGIAEGFYTFRTEMEERGHGCPKGFDPPVHWNELYDNKLFWTPRGGQDDPENRKKYYQLADMKEEAAKARDIGCEALYLDPGWDTNFASKVWDESRLGKLTDFVELLRRDYGLKLSLHTPLSGWCNPTSYARNINRMGADGKRLELSLCGASRQYVEETLRRLDTLARDGATFFMFDGTMFNGQCWDPEHGHGVPSTRHEHVEATDRLARLVHATYPNVLIEMHDQMMGGFHFRYVPTYYGHDAGPVNNRGTEAPGFDTVWGFELMWDPMTDLVGGHSITLYYYNLAYSLPLYLHIDLRKDNAQALMFWWNASTCRHLGIGGTHSDAATHAAHKNAMAAYRRLKPFFAAGVFYGIDELTHVHRHPTAQAAVVNCFNLEDRAVVRDFELHPARCGLAPGRAYKFVGAESVHGASPYRIAVKIPAYGHVLVEIG
jgi:hypothetical protein